MSRSTLEDTLAKHIDRLMGLAGVTAVGQGEYLGQPCIKLYLSSADPALVQQLPRQLDQFPVIVEVSGNILARPPN